jgi:hypothetical protein
MIFEIASFSFKIGILMLYVRSTFASPSEMLFVVWVHGWIEEVQIPSRLHCSR